MKTSNNMITSWKISQRVFATLLLGLLLPLVGTIGICLWLEDKNGVFFRQERWGKGGRVFTIYKFRTMRKGAENEQRELRHQNEADGPVFKIWNDPRHTRVGRWLSHRGLDELPQLINVIRGEMVFVGPRPLPVEEAKKVPRRYFRRYEVLPGLTSSWVVNGAHNLSFQEWMKYDLEDVSEQGVRRDLRIMGKTIWMMGEGLIKRGENAKI